MSNSPINSEQSTLLVQTENQCNPGAARPSDFKVEDRDGGQSSQALLTEPIATGSPNWAHPSLSATRSQTGESAMNKAQRRKLHYGINRLTADGVAAIVRQQFPRAKGGKIDQLAKAVIANAHRQFSPRKTQRG